MKVRAFARLPGSKVMTVLFVLGFVVIVPVTGARAQGKSIRTCQIIVEPGPYTLVKAITATASDLVPGPLGLDVCILIAADYVTFDLQGYTISGPHTPATGGISTDGDHRTGVKVHSGAVTQFGYGVLLFGSGHTVERINASDNVYVGIQVRSSGPSVAGHRIVGNTVMRNGDIFFGWGINVQCPSVVLDNVATPNGGDTSADILAGDCTRLGNSPAP